MSLISLITDKLGNRWLSFTMYLISYLPKVAKIVEKYQKVAKMAKPYQKYQMFIKNDLIYQNKLVSSYNGQIWEEMVKLFSKSDKKYLKIPDFIKNYLTATSLFPLITDKFGNRWLNFFRKVPKSI